MSNIMLYYNLGLFFLLWPLSNNNYIPNQYRHFLKECFRLKNLIKSFNLEHLLGSVSLMVTGGNDSGFMNEKKIC